MRRPSPYHSPMSPIDPAARRRAEAAWSELRDHLEACTRAIREEVRRYPTPIAACDVQLTELIERRARALDRMKAMGEADSAQASGRRPAMEAFLAAPPAFADDAAEARLRDRLRGALHGMIGG